MTEHIGEPAGGVEWRDCCATEDCMRPSTERFEYGGVGSLYCKDCYDKIMALCASPAVTVGVKPLHYRDAPDNHHRCLCAKCGECVKTGDPRWMSDFFLPERCPSCGAFKDRYGYVPYGSQWVISYGFWREVPGQPPKSVFKPSTWRRVIEWIDFDSGLPVALPKFLEPIP